MLCAGTSVGTDKIKMDMLGGSETDSVDPEDQRDSTSVMDSSRASSVEPGIIVRSQVVEHEIERELIRNVEYISFILLSLLLSE